MKILAILILMGSMVVLQANAKARVDHREKKQGARIHQGMKSGELTKREASQLHIQQRKIRNAERRARADGVLSKKEKAHLEKMQDNSSKNIYSKKHNDKDRGENAPSNSGEGSAAPAEPTTTE